MLRILPPTNQTCLATNQVVASCVNTDFWLDKITRESLARELRHYLQSNGKTDNIYRFYLESLYFVPKVSQPNLLQDRLDF